MNHSHVLYDSDPHFRIDPVSRNIIDESNKKVRLIQHDHNSERFTFEIPKYIEGHDMTSCNLVEIHYTNVESNTKISRGGVYTVDDLQVKSDDADTVVLSWLIPNNATQYVGTLHFLIRFTCVNESTGKLEYVWNTAIYSGITVSTGIYNTDSPSDNSPPPFNFVTTISGDIVKFFVGTKDAYMGLSSEERNDLLSIFTDDTTFEEIDAAVEKVEAAAERFDDVFDDVKTELINAIENGTVVVPSTKSVIGQDVEAAAVSIDSGRGTMKYGSLGMSGIYLARLVDTRLSITYSGVFYHDQTQNAENWSIGNKWVHHTPSDGKIYIIDNNVEFTGNNTTDVVGAIRFYKLGGI